MGIDKLDAQLGVLLPYTLANVVFLGDPTLGCLSLAHILGNPTNSEDSVI